MGEKKAKIELLKAGILFEGYAHRRHKKNKAKGTSDRKRKIINHIILEMEKEIKKV